MIACLARHRRLIVLATLSATALFACNGGAPNPDTGGADTGPTLDSGPPIDGTMAQDVPPTGVDMHRMRDLGAEVQLDSACTNCFVNVSPDPGAASATFNVTGMGFECYGTTVPLSIQMVGSPPIYMMDVPVTNGSFSVNFMHAGLAPGTYTATGGMFGPTGCSYDATFHIIP